MCPVRSGLRKARTDKGLTLQAVADMTHYSYGTIARAERGLLYTGTKPDVRREAFWTAMSDFYGIPENELKEVYE